ncbi:double-strand break repair protein AddB [Marinibacterium sp. SX1]|uniref:double-strand break repair protein AddB n=1 Tax=Marinibacterium sp. SX1 TaxID=3388424 RepID=UPI003D162F63
MFEPSDKARVFALPCGADFPAQLVAGLESRMQGQPPEAWARILLIVNTRRMARRLRDIFDAGPPRLLPQIRLMTDLDTGLDDIPPAIPPLRRRLELAQLVSRLIEAEPDLAPRAAVYDLADSLADLFAEMQGEGVSPDTIAGLDVSDLSGHWARAQRFIAIAGMLADPEAPEAEARQRLVAESLAARWAEAPPETPVILAGSTGSRGMMQILMQAAARLPQGAVVLPGHDPDLPDEVWDGMRAALTAEDHPQYRYKALMDRMDLAPGDIRPWTDSPPPALERNRVLSLALRPAPVTDAWLTEGPSLPDLGPAMAGVTLLEATDPREEALAIALRLRQAAEDGQTAALITPDRMLTRQVEAALDRWGIMADDSAGQPLHLAPPGRFLRQVADLIANPVTPESLLAMLKHPLCHSGPGRADHLIYTRDLELWLRRNAPPHPEPATLDRFASDMVDRKRTPPPEPWRAWVADALLCAHDPAVAPLAGRVGALRARAERVAAGSQADDPAETGGLWDQNAGQEARKVIEALELHADAGGDMAARDVADLLGALLQRETVRDRDKPHPGIMIWGTLEARVQGADLLILGGLNEGSWPEAARPDPWLNRALRNQVGLLLPERRIGLAAHDFQQAAGAEEVWITRAKRSSDAETVPSRWVNRLVNLLGGLPQRGGPEALTAMRGRGRLWLDRVTELERAERTAPAIRPSPRPPVEARPQQLSVTRIKTLIRDPYAIYAQTVLKLRALDPLMTEPDAMLRGTVIHTVLEDFIRETADTPDEVTPERLMQVADRVLATEVPWAAERRLWRARLARVAGWFTDGERTRRSLGTPEAFEIYGEVLIEDPPFRLTGEADRIDRDTSGRWVIYDYKTGRPPTAKEQKLFDKQLLLEAAMIGQGAFKGLTPAPVARAVFLGLGGAGKEEPAPLDETPVEQVWEEFRDLLRAYRDPAQGYTARRMLQKDSDVGDYDQLARYGEWDMATDPTPEDLA